VARILVADDEPNVRLFVRLACEKAGHEVHEAIDAPSAVLAYDRAPPDLLVLDVNMPGGGAAFVLNSLRFGGTRAIAPVLIVSGSLEQTPQEAQRRFAVDRVLVKPFRVSELLSSIAELIAKRAKAAGKPASPPPAPPAPFPPDAPRPS
jgi:DNA-binding response OmpR family regulator